MCIRDRRDVALALIHLAELKTEGAFNVCSGIPVSLRTVLETLAEELGRKELLDFGARPYAASEVMVLCGEASKLRETGWKPLHSDLRASLRELLTTTEQNP